MHRTEAAFNFTEKLFLLLSSVMFLKNIKMRQRFLDITLIFDFFD